MKDQNLSVLENKIRIQVESSRVRLTEFFIDFDRLRSGYVSKTQFRRVLDQIMKIALTDDEINALADKYGSTQRNSLNNINYKQFCNTINRLFPENEMRENPESNVFKPPEYLGTFRSMKSLNPENEMILRNILTRLNTHYSKRNTDILHDFRDFDRNNIGILTESQFRRCMNEPTLSSDDIELLITKYQHPDRKGFISYLNFYNDVKINPDNNSQTNQYQTTNAKPIQETGLSIQEIIDRISIVCYKHGIRISDFFKDFDRLRSGVITERQFSSGLIVGLEKAANLCPDDIYQLAEYFRQPDGRVEYKAFCDTVENVFNIPDMEKKPLAYVKRPPQGLIAKTLNGNLTPYEEESVEACLKVISERVRKYKLQVFPYFKDYDRSTAFTRNVSKIQFGRVLSTLGLMPEIELFGLLCKKFEDGVSGDISYPLFCQAVDDEYVSAKIEEQKYEEDLKTEQIYAKDLPLDTTDVDMNELIGRIRSLTLANRIRIKEYFQDMDPLNSGHVSKPQFIRCISSFGISSLGGFNISKAQTEVLCKRYQNSNNNKINWKMFEDEVETVFTVKNLEKNPNLRVAPTDLFIMPPQGTASWEDENLDNADNYKTIIENLKTVVQQRRLDCWPPFKDYDHLNRGHVTKKQFYQSLNKIGLNLNATDVAVLEAKFMNSLGFNYRHFLSYLQPIEVEKLKYDDLKKELDRLNTIKPVFESNPLFDVQSILIKIKDQVFKRRVSIYEWLRDHDKLNSGRLLKETFKRAIDLCKLDIEPSEVELIINYFSSEKDPRMVEYKEFCFEIEKAFANSEMEKNPLVEAEQHVPKNQVDLNVLLPDEVDKLEISLRKIAERVRAQRMQIFPRFEDFDRIKNGFVTRNQFIRVLNDINLGSMLNETEMNCVLKKFSVRIGTRDDVNYVKFADTIYDLGSFEYRLP